MVGITCMFFACKPATTTEAPAQVEAPPASTTEVTPTATTPAAPAPAATAHVCTANCKDGKHAYAHGEEGHTCTDACKKM